MPIHPVGSHFFFFPLWSQLWQGIFYRGERGLGEDFILRVMRVRFVEIFRSNYGRVSRTARKLYPTGLLTLIKGVNLVRRWREGRGGLAVLIFILCEYRSVGSCVHCDYGEKFVR